MIYPPRIGRKNLVRYKRIVKRGVDHIMMPAPVTHGTLVFALIAAAIIASFWGASKRGMVSNDSFQIVSVVTATLAVSMWLMWVCTWMHQWHPLIQPIYKDE